MQRVAGDEAPRPTEKVTEAFNKLAESARNPPIPPDYYVWLQIYCAAMSNNNGVYTECQLADRGLEKFKRRFPSQ